MLMTISTTHQPATDLGYLLHKHPDKCQSFSLSFGKAHVFYPENSEEKCTAALLLDLDPIGLVRRKNKSGWALSQYVNDRPYVASSFLGVAIAKVFSSALQGRSKDRPELLEKKIPLEVHIPALSCRGGEPILRRFFEPLGYQLSIKSYPLDTEFPEWGESRIFSLTLKVESTLQALLSHLYVLIPALDSEKHYWVGEDEVEKLTRHGDVWLSEHPEQELILRRSLKHRHSLVKQAQSKLKIAELEEEPMRQLDQEEEVVEAPLRLHTIRLKQVRQTLLDLGVQSVLDLGCGEGKLLRLLLKKSQFKTIVGADVSMRSLEIAKERLHWDRMSERELSRISLFQSALTYHDKRLAGFDAAVLVEVIEHLEPNRLDALASSVFQAAAPKYIILTTPNAEYNELFDTLPAGKFRHRDHRFEWTRKEFRAWSEQKAKEFGYRVSFSPIGAVDPNLGGPSQMGVFEKIAGT